MEEKNNFEIISDNGSSLNISPAYDHLNIVTPKFSSQKPNYIVIPKVTTEKLENNN